MNEIHEMLQHINELAVKGENGTMASSCMSENELLMEVSCKSTEEFETNHVDSFFIKSGNEQKYADGGKKVFEVGMLFRFLNLMQTKWAVIMSAKM